MLVQALEKQSAEAVESRVHWGGGKAPQGEVLSREGYLEQEFYADRATGAKVLMQGLVLSVPGTGKKPEWQERVSRRSGRR